MNQNFFKLHNEFKRIKRRGWVEGVGKGYNNIGITFETLLGISSNELEIPDYEGIEIKTKRCFVTSFNSHITLFSCKPQGKYYHETQRLKDEYGYPHKELKEFNVLNNSVYCNKKNKIGIKYFFKLAMSPLEERIYLEIYDLKGKLLEKDVYWEFCELKEKLYRKLKYLALVYALSQKIVETNKEKFKYVKFNLYKLKGFDVFLEMLEKGYIRVNFKLNIWSSGDKKGKIHDHGTSFDILEDKIEYLYKKLY